MPISLFIGVLTLVPALVAILIAGLGAARRALAPAVFALCALGALVPVICLLILAPYLGNGEPLRLTLFGGSLAENAWFSAVYRADAFGVYAGLGLAILVVPLLLWMAWKGRLTPAAPVAAPAKEAEQVDGEAVETEETKAAPEETEEPEETAGAPVESPTRPMLPMRIWAGVALTLAAESAALTVLFADNILWLALAWLVLAAIIWGLGELDAEAIDRVGLGVMLAGPVLWALMMLTGAVPAKSPTLFKLMGRGAYSPVQVILLALVIALAAGAYPFLAWMRRRAALATPAGLGALLLVLLPVVLFAAARTYGAASDASGQWAEIGKAAPPVYGGIAWAVLGAVTVGVCGMLALERRDNRALLAYLAVAQIGWGMLALSTGDPMSLAGIVLLLAGAVFGLGAMLAAIFAGGTLTDDEEPDGAGPRAFGTRFSPASLFAWCVGAVSLIGVPLFGGFAAREVTSAAALQLGNLTVPLVGVAWAGDALLGLALLRATAPAFTQLTSETGDEEDAEDAEDVDDNVETLAAVAVSTKQDDDEVTEDEADEDDEGNVADEGEDEAEQKPGVRTTRTPRGDIRALPALIFGLLAVALGIAPQALLAFFGGTLAAGTLAPTHAVDTTLRTTQVGFATGFGQWLPGIAWGALVVLALVFTFTRPDSLRAVRLPKAADQAAVASDSAEYAPELIGQPEPVETWQELSTVFVSPVTLPAGAWLLSDGGTEEGEGEADAVDEVGAIVGEKAGGEGAEGAKELEELEELEVTEEMGKPVEVTAPAAPPAAAKVARNAPEDAEAALPSADESDETSDDFDSTESNDTPAQPAPAVKATKPATTPAAKAMTSRSAIPPAKAEMPAAKSSAPVTKADSTAAKTASAGAKTTTGGAGPKSGPKSAPSPSGVKPNTPAKSPTKPANGKASVSAAAKSSRSGSKPGGKKQPGGRA